MTHTALIRIAQVVTADVMLDHDTIRAGRQLVQRGALELQPDSPLLVNHDPDREVGRVLELVEWDLWDGLWSCARCEIDGAPGWLERGTRASYGYACLHEQAIGEWSRLLRGLVTEVSILSPSVQPREPRAAVMLLQRAEGHQAGEVILGGQRIIRQNVGQVLGVR